MQRESVLQKKCMDFCKKNAYLCYKIDSSSTAGIPDLLIISSEGRTTHVELKTSVGTLSAIQKHVIKKLKESNANVYVCRTLTEFKEAIAPAPD